MAEHVKSLNGLRALLFLFIFGAHFKYEIIYSELGRKFFTFFNLARFAILFFVLLSGFCMALGYLDKFKTVSKESYLNFIKKRFFKLYPLYFITGLIGLLFLYLPQGIKWLYLFIFVYVPMLTTWLGIDAGGNGSGWFIGSIFFCYLLTPLIIFWLNKKSDLKFHLSFCFINYLLLAIFSIVLIVLKDPNNEYLYRFPVIRLFEYIIALDTGYIFIKYLKNKLQFQFFNNYFYKSLIDIVFISLFIITMYVLPNNLLPRHIIGIPLMCIFIIYLCIAKRSLLYDIFNSKICNFLGNISFECYLIHYIVIRLMSSYSAERNSTLCDIIILYFTLLGLTVCIAYVYQKLEKLIKKQFNIC